MPREIDGAGMSNPPNDRTHEQAVEELAAKTDSDIIFYNGVIDRPCDEAVMRDTISRKEKRRSNVIFILVTHGGNPDAAYRIARCLQRAYKKITVYVPGPCKSAGTLLAIGAHELLISDHGELGPLDIQMAKKDELFGSQSGLTVTTALQAVEDRMFEAAQRLVFEIEANSGGMLSIQTATALAAQLVTGLYAPIAAQIDPMHLGEASRALLIADRYGRRLAEKSGNLARPDALQRLYTAYPSHGFVIDREEAKNYFANVREPDALELEVIERYGLYGRRVRPQPQASVNPVGIVKFWSKPVTRSNTSTNGKTKGNSHAAANGTRGNPAAGDSARPVTRTPSAQPRRARTAPVKGSPRKAKNGGI